MLPALVCFLTSLWHEATSFGDWTKEHPAAHFRYRNLMNFLSAQMSLMERSPCAAIFEELMIALTLGLSPSIQCTGLRKCEHHFASSCILLLTSSFSLAQGRARPETSGRLRPLQFARSIGAEELRPVGCGSGVGVGDLNF